jgi:hypothetical protein
MSDYKQAFLARELPYEGKVSHFYLDTEGLVTIGEGCQVELPEALTLPLQDKNGTPATQSAIEEDWKYVQAQPKGLSAAHYVWSGTLFLSDDAITALAMKRVDAIDAAMHKVFPQFDTWPDCCKIAMMEVPWGDGNLTLSKWPHLKSAGLAKNWGMCAQECEWSDPLGIYAARNLGRKQLFMEAVS